MIDFMNMNPGKLPSIIHAVIEIPKDGTHKYELDKELGAFVLDRPLYTSVHYPGDYGFIPQTLAEDGDPLDILVKIDKPTFPGCVIKVRAVGALKMIDKGKNDHKIIAVPISDPRCGHVYDVKNISKHFAAEVDHFFTVYKELEGKETCTDGWMNKDEAERLIMEAHERWKTSTANSDSIMYKIWCEYDMGMGWEDVIFSSREKAEEEMKSADWDMVDMSFEEVLEQGLVNIEEVTIN